MEIGDFEESPLRGMEYLQSKPFFESSLSLEPNNGILDGFLLKELRPSSLPFLKYPGR